MLQVRQVEDRAARRQFVRMPWRIYKNDQHWVPPLLIERAHHISKRNPVFQHLQWCPFLAFQDGKPVGRISAQVDRLHLERYADGTGFFGMLEAPDDEQVFAALFAAAESWLRDQGMQRVRGPYNLAVNEECGLLVDGFDSPQFVMMGHAPRYYGARVEAHGYNGVKDLLAYRVGTDYVHSEVQKKIIHRAMKEGGRAKMRNICKQEFDRDLEIMRDIFNDAWSDNWGFVPFTAAEFKELGSALNLILAEDMVKIIDVDGEPAGFMVVLPNVNEAQRDLNGRLLPFGWLKLLWRLKVAYPKTGRVPLMGVRKRYHNTTLGAGLALALIEGIRVATAKKGVLYGEMSWILEDNKSMRAIIEGLQGTVTKRYRIYEKNLTL